jgi:hypothetical protein
VNEEAVEQPQEEEQTGPPSLDGDEDLQRAVLSKIREHNAKGKANRMAEVQNARDQRLYYRGIQQFYWSEDTENVVFESDDDSPYDRTFNIFQGYGKIFQSTFMGARPKVRAEADDPFNSTSIRNTAKAQTYERVYRKFNDTPTQQLEAARLMWTDGRIVTRTSQRDGKEITEFWGVLESRVPITAKDDIEVPLKNCPLIELEDEYPIVQMKRDVGDKQNSKGEEIRKKISSGNGDSYERNARLAVKRQAGTDTSLDATTGEDNYGLATKTWSYMRPEFYEHFQEADRVELEQMFPTGLCLIRSGDIYLESYPCEIDAELDVIHALPGDGMSRPSIGATTMPLQDAYNTSKNLIEEQFDHGIPTTYFDKRSDIDGLNKSREQPGQSRKATGVAGQPLESLFYQTVPVNPPQQLFNYAENLRGPEAQFVSGQQPALFGAEMQDQKTASGYAQARSMALGQMAIVWKPYTAWFAREMTRAVRMASNRPDEIKTTLPAQRKGGKPEAVKLSPADLVGLSFTNESDENFPETWTEKSNKVMNLLQMGGEVADWVLQEEPDNLYMLKQLIGLEELVIPGEDMRNNVLADIAQMEHEAPQPDPNQMPQQALPAPGAPPMQPQLVSSIQLDPDYLEDQDYEVGWKTVKHWVQSAVGQEAKVSNPMWFENVRLYGLEYKQGMEAAQAAKAQANQPPLPPDLPKVAIPYDSLPPGGKVQAAAKAGIQLTPEDVQQAAIQDAAQNAPAGV